MKNITKIILFILIFFILWKIIFKVLWLPDDIIDEFYKAPPNSMDVVYIGASNVSSSFNPLLAYHSYGFITGVMSSGGQPFTAIKYLIKEAQKTQNPNVYVIDIYMLENEVDSFNEGDMRKTVDAMNYSKNKFDAITDILKYAHIDKSEYINYYFSFLLYHNSWKNININNFIGNFPYRGYWYYDLSKSTAQQIPKWDDKIEQLSQDSRQVLLDLIDYIKSNNINVLFVVPKRGYWSQNKMNDAISIIESSDLDIINFNKLDDLQIDPAIDFYDYGHLNIYGAVKYTAYFAKYLKEKYNLKNHYGERLYLSWNNEYKEFEQDFKNITGLDLTKYLYEYYMSIN